MHDVSITALMPMKAHSVRLPNKNIKKFNGMPLYEVQLDTLLNSKYIKEIIIDTDIEEILSCRDFNERIKIVERPERLRDDYVPFFDIIEYDMAQTNSNIFLHTHSTNPMLKTKTIDNAILTFAKNEDCDSLIGVNKHFKRFYYSDKQPVNHNPHDKLLRTQDLKPLYADSSCIYIFTRESFQNVGKHRIGETPYFFEVNEIESIDIDYEKDFILAEKIYRVFKG